jgi:hypothetical protein
MCAILEFMQASLNAAEHARKRDFYAAERARKEELALICKQIQSSSMIMMQIMASITTGRRQNEEKDRTQKVLGRRTILLYSTDVRIRIVQFILF